MSYQLASKLKDLLSKLKDLLSLFLKDVGTNLKAFPLEQD